MSSAVLYADMSESAPPPSRAFLTALIASLVLHGVLLIFVPSLRIKPPEEPAPLQVELVRLPPVVEPEQPKVVQPTPPPPKPKVERRPEPPPIEHVQPRVEPTPVPAPLPLPTPAPMPKVEVPSPPTVQAPVAPPPQPEAPPPMPRTPEVTQTPKQPPPQAAPTASTAPVNVEPDPSLLKSFGSDLSRLIGKLQRYPQLARMRNWQGTTQVRLHFAPDGKVDDISMVQGSGFSVLDQEAMKMVKDSLPLPMPPTALQGKAFNITVPIVFVLRQ